jgi:hypothetical protein
MSGAAEADGRDDLAGLANSGAKILPFVLGALVLSVLGGGALALKRRKS